MITFVFLFAAIGLFVIRCIFSAIASKEDYFVEVGEGYTVEHESGSPDWIPAPQERRTSNVGAWLHLFASLFLLLSLTSLCIFLVMFMFVHI